MKKLFFGVVSLYTGRDEPHNEFFSGLAESGDELLGRAIERAAAEYPEGEIENRVVYEIDEETIRQAYAELSSVLPVGGSAG